MVSAITMAPLTHAPTSLTRSKSSSRHDDEHHGDDEVDNLDHFVKRRHLGLEKENEARDNEPGYPRLDERGQAATMKKSSRLVRHASPRRARSARESPVIRITVQSSSGTAPMRL
jgi:hypothetical protein